MPSSALLKRPAASVALSSCCVAHVLVGQSSCNAPLWTGGRSSVDTKDDLIRMGSAAVRNSLESQRRYSRKRHRARAVAQSSGEENKISKWAKLLVINLGKVVDDSSRKDGKKWEHKGRHDLIDEIVAAVERAQPV